MTKTRSFLSFSTDPVEQLQHECASMATRLEGKQEFMRSMLNADYTSIESLNAIPELYSDSAMSRCDATEFVKRMSYDLVMVQLNHKFLREIDCRVQFLVFKSINTDISTGKAAVLVRLIDSSFSTYPNCELIRSTLRSLVPHSTPNAGWNVVGCEVQFSEHVADMVGKLVGTLQSISTNGIDLNPRFEGLNAASILPTFLQELFDAKGSLADLVNVSLFVILLFLRYQYPSSIALNTLCAVYAIYNLTRGVAYIKDVVIQWIAPVAQAGGDALVELAVEAISLTLFTKNCKFTDLKSFGDSIVNLEKHSGSLSRYLIRVKEFITKAIFCVCEYFGIKMNWQTGRFQSEIDGIESLIQSLLDDFSKVKGQYIPFSLCTDMQRIDQVILDLEFKIKADLDSKCVRDVLQNYKRLLQPIRAAVNSSSHASREEPFLTYICSHPGSGKSYSENYITSNISVMAFDEKQLLDYEESPKRCVYYHEVGAKHMDGYTGQPVYVMNDAFAAMDVAGQESEATFLINAIGANEHRLPQAELTKKGQIMDLAKLFIINSNVTYIYPDMFKSLREPKALVRRLNANAWFQTVKPEYWDHSTPVNHKWKDKPQFYMKIDPSKLVSLNAKGQPTFYDAYNYYKWDVANDRPIDDWAFSLDEFLSENRKKFVDRLEANDQKRDGDALHFKSIITERRKELKTKSLPQGNDDESEYSECSSCFDTADSVTSTDFGPIYDKVPYSNHATHEFRDFSKQELFERMAIKTQADHMSSERRCEILLSFKSDDLVRLFIRDYMCACIEAEERLEFNAFRHYKDDIDHPLHALLNNCSFQEMDFLVTSNMCDYMILEYCRIKTMGYNFVESVVHTSRSMMKMINQFFFDVKEKWWLWFAAHPYLGSLVIAGGISTIGLGTSFIIVNALCRFASFYLGEKDVELIYTCPTCCDMMNSKVVTGRMCELHQMMTNGTNEYDSVPACDVISNYHTRSIKCFGKCPECRLGGMCGKLARGETFSPVRSRNNEEEMVSTIEILPSSNQAGFSDNTTFIDARLGNGYKIIMYRTVTGEKEQVWSNETSALWFIGGKVAMTNYHVYLNLQAYLKMPSTTKVKMGLSSMLVSGNTCQHIFEYSSLILEHVDVLHDMVFFTMPIINEMPSMMKYFPSLNDKGFVDYIKNPRSITEITVIFKRNGKIIYHKGRMRYSGGGCHYPSTGYLSDPLSGKRYSTAELGISDPVIVHPECWTLDILTERGDCMSMGFMTDEVRKRFCSESPIYQQPIPIYSHNSADSSRIAQGIIVFREYFDPIKHLIKNKIRAPVERISESISHCKDAFREMCTGIEKRLDLTPPKLEYEDFEIHHKVLAELPPSNKITRSSINKSKLYGIFPRTKKPIRLYDHIKDGELIKVMPLARKDYGSNLDIVLPHRMSEYIGERIAQQIILDSGPIKTRRNLTYEEAIIGCPELQLPPISMGTSPGVTLNLIKDTFGFKGKGKKWIFGHGINPDFNTKEAKCFRTYFEYCHSLLKNGDRYPNVYGDNLKDETRPPGKTARLFCAGEFGFLILCKMYLGAWTSWMQENRIRNRVAVGINPCSSEWDDLYNYLCSLSEDELCAIFGDFAKFDKRQLKEVMYTTWRCIRSYYGNEDKESNNIRWLLFQDIIDSLHYVPGNTASIIYAWLHGNTSGNFLTANLNSISNIYIHTFCMCALVMISNRKSLEVYLICDIPFDFVWNNSRQATYGDDSVLVVRNMKCVNFNTMKWAIEKFFGMKYTDELKTEGIIPDYRAVRDGSFISRRFKVTYVGGRRKIRSPLKKTSILESFQWQRDGVGDEEIVEVAQASVIEMVQHEKEDFDDFVSILEPAIEERMGRSLNVITYEMAFALLEERQAQNWYLSPDGQLVKPDADNIFMTKICPTAVNREQFEYLGHDDDLIKSFGVMIPKEDELASNSHIVNKQIAGDSDSKAISESLCERSVVKTLASISQSSNVENRIMGGDCSNESMKNPVICDSSATTCWTEAAGKVESSLAKPTMLQGMIQKSESIEEFLSKPFLLTTVQYTTSTAANADIYSFDIAPLLASVTQWANKIQGFALMSGTFCCRTEITAYPFQGGGFIFHYMPNHADIIAGNNIHLDSSHNANLNAKYQHPYVEADLRDTVVEFKIPYISPTSFYGIKEGFCDWGKFFITALAPLRTGASGLTYADLSVYGYWEDVKLAAPSVPQINMKETKEGGKPISKGLSFIGKAAKSFAQIPEISTIAGTVEWVARMASGVASVFGWSKPIIDDPPRVVTRQTMRYAGTSDGTDISVPTSVTYDNQLVMTNRYSITSEDEMSLKFLTRIPSYFKTISWTTGNASGTSLYNTNITPSVFAVNGSSAHGGHTVNWVQGAPIAYLATLFAYWRGDIMIRGKILKTDYHSGRFQLTWTPGTSTGTAPTLATSVLSYRQIIDIREQSEFEFNLPYTVLSPYLTTVGSGSYSGRLDIIVLNDLRAPETCSGTVDILLYGYAGDNFEFQVPTNSSFGNQPFIPQSNCSEVLVSSGIADTPKYPLNTMFSSACIGEHITSLKQMLNRFSQLRSLTSSSSQLISNSYKINYFPYFAACNTIHPTSGALLGSPYGTDAYSFIAPMYAFQRGSSRFGIYSDAPASSTGTKVGDQHITVLSRPQLFNGASTLCGVDTQINITGTGQSTNGSPAAGTTISTLPFQSPNPNDLGVGISYHQIPYYSRHPVSHVSIANGYDFLYTTDPTGPDTGLFACIQNVSNTFDSTTVIGRSFADDFTLSFFIGCPPLSTSYA